MVLVTRMIRDCVGWLVIVVFKTVRDGCGSFSLHKESFDPIPIAGARLLNRSLTHSETRSTTFHAPDTALQEMERALRTMLMEHYKSIPSKRTIWRATTPTSLATPSMVVSRIISQSPEEPAIDI